MAKRSLKDGGKRKINQSYNDWKDKISKYKNIDIDNDKTYDYESFYNEDQDRAYSMLIENPKAHFTDKYKTPLHPTFSTESIYSKGDTIGGKWVEHDNGKWEFQHSDYTAQHSNETNNYLRREDPNSIATYKGGIMLDEITAEPYIADLITYMPGKSVYKYTGHSLLNAFRGVDHKDNIVISKDSKNPTYNLLFNNCSDATAKALGLSTKGITTPWGVRNLVKETFNDIKEMSFGRGATRIRIPINKKQYDNIKKVYDEERKLSLSGDY